MCVCYHQQVRHHLNAGNIDVILDPAIKVPRPSFDAVWKVADTAMKCVEPKSLNRPTMSEVVQDLQVALNMVDPSISNSNSQFSENSNAHQIPVSMPVPRWLVSLEYSYWCDHSCKQHTWCSMFSLSCACVVLIEFEECVFWKLTYTIVKFLEGFYKTMQWLPPTTPFSLRKYRAWAALTLEKVVDLYPEGPKRRSDWWRLAHKKINTC